jgi:hypothetical protein
VPTQEAEGVERCTWREPSDPFRQRLEALPPSPEGTEEEAIMGPVRHGTDPYDGAYSLILSVPNPAGAAADPYAFSSGAHASSRRFSPLPWKATIASAAPPRPMTSTTVPSPQWACRTRSPLAISIPFPVARGF